MTTYATIDPAEVQFFLDNTGGKEFTVIFLKTDGTQRKLTGNLDTSVSTRKTSVPMMDKESGQWKSFNISRVLWIGQ